MDRKCDTCGHTTHDGEGYCRFCRTPFPAEEIAEEPDDVVFAPKGRKKP